MEKKVWKKRFGKMDWKKSLEKRFGKRFEKRFGKKVWKKVWKKGLEKGLEKRCSKKVCCCYNYDSIMSGGYPPSCNSVTAATVTVVTVVRSGQVERARSSGPGDACAPESKLGKPRWVIIVLIIL